jgi:hypothetical protein
MRRLDADPFCNERRIHAESALFEFHSAHRTRPAAPSLMTGFPLLHDIVRERRAVASSLPAYGASSVSRCLWLAPFATR